MANDRVFLRCKHCGEAMLLAKYYPDHPYPPPEAIRRLDPFLGKHLAECNEWPGDLGSDCGLELHTEATLPEGTFDKERAELLAAMKAREVKTDQNG